MRNRLPILCLLASALSSGCGGNQPNDNGGTTGDKPPVFVLAPSEYPSWSVFMVAAENGLLDGAEGKLGTVEKKHNVDIVVTPGDYDTTITQYASNTADAVCVTNMDALAPSLRRRSRAILATSTSDGADAVLTTLPDFASLKDKSVFGLEKSVSEYLVHRLVEKNGMQDGDVKFQTMDPAAAATALQTKQNGIDAICVWNPFVLQTLQVRNDVKDVGNSASIPMEIIDMVVVGEDSLAKPGGKDFAAAIVETFYEFSKMLDADKSDKLLVALGEKFSHLDAHAMRTVLRQTRFFKTGKEGAAVFGAAQGAEGFPAVMGRIASFCVSRKIVDRKPVIAVYGVDGDVKNADLLFDPSFMQAN